MMRGLNAFVCTIFLIMSYHIRTPYNYFLFYFRINFILRFQKSENLEDIYKKEVERTMQQLQDKLQLNIIQQSQLVQTHDKTNNVETLQQMVVHQQQIVQQIQMSQRQYALQPGTSQHESGNCQGKQTGTDIVISFSDLVYVINFKIIYRSIFQFE